MTRRHRTGGVAALAGAFVMVLSACASGDDATGSSPSSLPTDPTAVTATPPRPGSTVDSSSTTATTSADADRPSVTAPTATVTDTHVASDRAAPPARLDGVLDVEDFAARLSATYATMVDPAAAPDDRSRAGVDYQLVLRELAGRPDLDDAVLASLDPSARPTVERIVRARQFLQERSATRPPQPLPDELPAWTIVEPEPIDTLLGHYAEAEALTGIPWYWLAAIHLQETRMGRIQGVSSAGAVGPMQFLPTTWAVCCVGDPTVTRDAIIGAATYLQQSGGPDDMAAALYQYNPNDGYVAVVTAYAESFRDEPELLAGHHAFQVFFGSSAGTVRLPIGYRETAPIDAAAYLAANPHDAG